MTDPNNKIKIHFISFQVPYPPSYGGVIDVYYKIKALKDAGCSIFLHTFKYKREETDKLKEIADKVYYYKRKTGILSQISRYPYIVFSRKNNELLQRLKQDDYPILFEGLHTCYFISHPDLRNRIKLVRAHNIEHQYYYKLFLSSIPEPKSLYYLIEALKLKFFEKKIEHSNCILAITSKDKEYFENKYKNTKTLLVPCFYENSGIEEHNSSCETRPYLLYNGNLSVYENIKAVKFIIKKIYPKLKKTKLVIAGMNPTNEIKKLVSDHENISLISNPSEDDMNNLIKYAHINILITFQDTGIKLKLINALTKGNGFCIVNNKMLSEPSLKSVCIEANTVDEFIQSINTALKKHTTPEYIRNRKIFITKLYDNATNAKKIIQVLSETYHAQKDFNIS